MKFGRRDENKKYAVSQRIMPKLNGRSDKFKVANACQLINRECEC